uniref:Uncharacterized protein n=1 Tax=Salix viminalis TaxID=40686 RepID=A0A6N2LHY6_SALVM
MHNRPDIKKLSESQEGSSENARFSKPLLEALIHLETFLPQPKQIDYLDSLLIIHLTGQKVSILLVLLRGKSYLAFSWRWSMFFFYPFLNLPSDIRV